MNITFVNQSWLFAVMAWLVISLAFTFWPNRRRKPLRWWEIGGYFAALLGLAGLILQPQYPVARQQVLAVLTPGALPEQVKDIAAQHVYATAGVSEHVLQLSQAIPIYDLAQVARLHPGDQRVVVVGHGLEPYERLPQNWHLEFRPAPLPVGFSKLYWTQTIAVGESLLVQGRFLGQENVSVVELLDPTGRVAASALLGEDGHFSLETAPPLAGRHLFRLRANDTAGTVLKNEPLPLTVREVPMPSIAIRVGAPSFEIRALKTWASSQGGSLYIERKISADRFFKERIGQQTSASPNEGFEYFAAYDLLIFDGQSYLSLQQQQRQLLLRWVQKGKSLLILADSALLESRPVEGLEPFQLRPVSSTDSQTFPLWPGLKPQHWLPAHKLPAQISSDQVLPLIWNPAGQPLAGYYPHGKGAIALSTILDTHTWRTSGKPEVYAAFWNQLLSPILSINPPNQSFIPQDSLPRTGNWTLLTSLQRSNDVLNVMSPSGKTSHLMTSNDPYRPGLKGTFFQASEKGWHQVNPMANHAPWFVFDSGSYERMRAELKSVYTENCDFKEKGRRLADQAVTEPQSVALSWFFLLFVIGFTVLTVGWKWPR